MAKIVVCDHIHAKGLEILGAAKDVEVVNLADVDKKTLLTMLGDVDVAITRSSTDVDHAFLDAAPRLKAIVRAGVGVDNVDIQECSRRGIIVMNVPTANTIAAVELTMAHMLSCMRAFPYAHGQLKNDRIWKRENWYGRELFGKKLGIIGFGNIGSRVGVRAKAFGMEVIAYDPYIPPHKATDLGVAYTTDFEDILGCDIITIHTPKTKETINMITAKEIARMKDGVVLINCARGGLYNEDDLYEGLKSGKIAFAGIDVFNKEPATDNKLLDLPNVTVTPHLGANTIESQEKIAIEAAQQALDAARGIGYPNALNLPVKESEIKDEIRPYFELIQKMGFLAAQLNKGAINSIKVIAEGEIADYLDSLLTFAVVGVLRESIGEQINYVNAQFVAQERGIALQTLPKPNQSGYKNRLTIKLTTAKEVTMISGTIFDETNLRIVNINGFELDVEPKGKMIVLKNYDVPGVIGEIGTVLGRHKINISDFRLGRGGDGKALAVILLDSEPDAVVLEELSAIQATISLSFAEI
ncbi:MAG: phosphoglycerate dehydrogenase [Campylobacterales bacterium]